MKVVWTPIPEYYLDRIEFDLARIAIWHPEAKELVDRALQNLSSTRTNLEECSFDVKELYPKEIA